jgi:hypothetical protein
LLLILVPFALLVAVTATVLAARGRLTPQGPGADDGLPWWRNPPVWIGAMAVLVLLGVFVAPRLLGFTFLFLPFVWTRRLGRRPDHGPPGRPRTEDDEDPWADR